MSFTFFYIQLKGLFMTWIHFSQGIQQQKKSVSNHLNHQMFLFTRKYLSIFIYFFARVIIRNMHPTLLKILLNNKIPHNRKVHCYQPFKTKRLFQNTLLCARITQTISLRHCSFQKRLIIEVFSWEARILGGVSSYV